MDLYETLGVRAKATTFEIRRAYRHWARLLHPALNPGDIVSAARFEQVTRAFEVLSDPAQRGAYDRGELSVGENLTVPQVGFEGFDFSTATPQEGIGFREIFTSFLSEPISKEGDVKGEDLQFTVRISLNEAFSGTRRRIHVVRQDRCPVCDGAGSVKCEATPCTQCHGTGQIKARRGHMVFSRPCFACRAIGTISARACNRCSGEGRLIKSEWLDVEIPPGARNGSDVRIPGGGNSGRRGGMSGDLTLTVEIEPHTFYRWEGDDLACTVPVTIVEAALGGHVEVPTPDGAVAIELPAGTQTGQRFRLRGRGAPRLGAKGRNDLYVEIRVLIPKVTDDDGRALLREVAGHISENPRAGLMSAAVFDQLRTDDTGRKHKYRG